MSGGHGMDGAQAIIGQEPRFLDYMHRLEDHKRGRRAVHVHIAQLQAESRHENHLGLAVNSFDDLVKRTLGQLFQMSNGDLIFVFRASVLDEVESIVVKLRFLFGEDPLLADDQDQPSGPFATWYDVEKDYATLLKLAQRLQMAAKQQRAYRVAKTRAPEARRAPAPTEPLTPELLASVEEALAQADLANHLRRQSVCVIVGHAQPKRLFDEVFISIADLRQTLLPKVNLASSPWLFQHLTETLDRRVLSLLIKGDDRSLSRDASINLNLATMLSEQFLVYDDNLPHNARGSIVLELQKTDIYADLGLYQFARDFAHERDYRICVDGLNHLTLPYVDRQRLGADLLKVVWSPEMTEPSPARDAFAEAVKRAGPSHIVLCRCDDPRAVDFGQELGIGLFQGRHVEIMLDAADDQKLARGRRRT